LYYKPSRVAINYQQYHFHIKTHTYEKLDVNISIPKKHNIMTGMVCEGPSPTVLELCTVKENSNELAGNIAVTTKTFQAFILLKSKRNDQSSINFTYKRLDSFENYYIVSINESGLVFKYPSKMCPLTTPITLCQIVLEAPDAGYVTAVIEEMLPMILTVTTLVYHGQTFISILFYVGIIYRRLFLDQQN